MSYCGGTIYINSQDQEQVISLLRNHFPPLGYLEVDFAPLPAMSTELRMIHMRGDGRQQPEKFYGWDFSEKSFRGFIVSPVIRNWLLIWESGNWPDERLAQWLSLSGEWNVVFAAWEESTECYYSRRFESGEITGLLDIEDGQIAADEGEFAGTNVRTFSLIKLLRSLSIPPGYGIAYSDAFLSPHLLSDLAPLDRYIHVAFGRK